MAGDGFVGVFDSGVGGISVLKHLVAELPSEHFVYFGDSAHAPYGSRTHDDVAALAGAIAARLVDDGAKALVIACNTATSAAAASLRAAYPTLPIIGVEPALKPAVAAHPHGRILVMATPLTLALDKYQQLAQSMHATAQVTPVACNGLAERIEQGDLGAPDLTALVDSLVGTYRGMVDGVVLGCTHYPFVADTIAAVVGDVAFYDSGAGCARQLRRCLAAGKLLRQRGTAGSVTFASSKDTPAELALYRWFFAQPIVGLSEA